MARYGHISIGRMSALASARAGHDISAWMAAEQTLRSAPSFTPNDVGSIALQGSAAATAPGETPKA